MKQEEQVQEGKHTRANRGTVAARLDTVYRHRRGGRSGYDAPRPQRKNHGYGCAVTLFSGASLCGYFVPELHFSAIALLIVNGLTNLTAALLLLLKKKSGVVLGGVFGVTLMLWTCIQFVIFPFNFMSTSYFVFGFCQAITGYMTWVFGKQETFRVNLSDYPNI